MLASTYVLILKKEYEYESYIVVSMDDLIFSDSPTSVSDVPRRLLSFIHYKLP